jgi:hypothetical protein
VAQRGNLVQGVGIALAPGLDLRDAHALLDDHAIAEALEGGRHERLRRAEATP